MRWVAGDGRALPRPHPRPNPPAEGGRRPTAFFVDFYASRRAAPGPARRASTPPRCPTRSARSARRRFRKATCPPLLLADDGAGRRHRRAQRRQHAQRPADAGQLRPAQRPRRPQRPAGPGLHLLLHRQPARPVLLPAAEQMVAGAVTPPRLDLANEDLVRAHVHAIWLAETGLSLGTVAQGRPRSRRRPAALELLAARAGRPSTRRTPRGAGQSARRRSPGRRSRTNWSSADWYSDGWLDEVLDQVAPQLRRRPASAGAASTGPRSSQREAQNKIILDAIARHRGQARRPSGCGARPRRSSSC